MVLERGTFKIVLVILAAALSATSCGAIEEMITQADCSQKYGEIAGDISDDSTAAEIIEAQEELANSEEFQNCGIRDR